MKLFRIILEGAYGKMHSDSLRAEDEKEILDTACARLAPWRRHNQAFKDGRWDGMVRLHDHSGKFPAGLYGEVAETILARHEDAQIKIVEFPKAQPVDLCRFTPDYLNGITLRDQQFRCCKSMLTRQRAALEAATNSGKTIMCAAMAKYLFCELGVRSLVLTSRKGLAKQTARKIAELVHPDVTVGQCGDGLKTFGDITVATAATMIGYRTRERSGGYISADHNLRRLLQSVGAIFIDECFVAGTRIDGVPIENIRVGDWVTTRTGRNRVSHVFKRRPSGLCVVKFISGRSFVCTPNHPVWTPGGFIAAGLLTPGSVVHSIMPHVPHGLHRMRGAVRRTLSTANMFHQMREEKTEAVAEAASTHEVCRLRSPRCCRRENFESIRPKGESILFTGVPSYVLCRTEFTTHDPDRFGARRANIETNATEESDAPAGCSRISVGQVAEHGLGSDGSRREWDRPDCATVAAGRRTGVADGSFDTDARAESGLSELLQGGYRAQGDARCRGSGWKQPRCLFAENSGPKEGSFSSFDRVDCVTIYEPDDREEFERLCPEGYVYNLEVENDPTYYANGILVHNCHHTGADTWYEIAMYCAATRRYAMSGTLHTKDELRDLQMLGASGPVADKITATEMIDLGESAQPKIAIVMSENVTGDLMPFEWGQRRDPKTNTLEMYKRFPAYNEAYVAGVVQSRTYNAAVVRAAKWLVDRDRNTLILCRRKEQFMILGELLEESGIKFAALWGATDTDTRDDAKAAYADREIRVILATTIFDEGEDLPAIEAIILAEGVKSYVNAVQRIGRGLRVERGGKRDVWIVDFCPTCHPRLMEHALARCEAYEAQGYDTRVWTEWPDDESSPLLPFDDWDDDAADTMPSKRSRAVVGA